MINKKIFMVLLVVLCVAGTFTHTSNASAKTYQTGTSVKKDLQKQKKKLKKLQIQYKKASALRKKAETAYKQQQKGVKAIFMGTVISTNPFIVRSSYILSPCKGYFLISNGKPFWNTYTGEIKLTGGTYRYGNIVCQRAKDVTSSTEVKKYEAAKKKEDAAHTSVKMCKDRISRMKKLLKDSVNLNDIEMTNGETIKYLDWNYKLNIWDDYYSKDFSKIKWKSSDNSIVSVSNNITTKEKRPTLKAKKEGTVTLSATYMTSKKTTKCEVKVNSKVNKIELSAECLEMPEDKKITISDYISVKCFPETAPQEVNFIVDDDSIDGITINNEKGTLKASYEGLYTVHVEPANGGEAGASFQVSVYDNSITINGKDYNEIKTYSGSVPAASFEECSNAVFEEYNSVGNVTIGGYTAYECPIASYIYNLDDGTQIKSQIAADSNPTRDIFFINTYKNTLGNEITMKIMVSRSYCMNALKGDIQCSIKGNGLEYSLFASAPLMDINNQCTLHWKGDYHFKDEISQDLQDTFNIIFRSALDGWEKSLYSTALIHMSDMGFGRAYQ